MDDLQELDLATLGEAPLEPSSSGGSRARYPLIPPKGRLSLSGSAPPKADPFEQSIISNLPDKAKPVTSLEDNMATAFPGNSPVFASPERIQRAKTLSATLGVPFSEAYDGVAGYSQAATKQDPDFFKMAGRSFIRGIGNTYVNAGRAAEWAFGAGPLSWSLYDTGTQLQDAYMPTVKPKDFTWNRVVDPEWWATTVSESVPSTLALIPAAIAGAYGGGMAAGALGLGAFGTAVLEGIGGAALARPIESAFEAAQSYDDALRKNLPESEARRQADTVFHNNLALGGLDAAQIALALTPLRVLGKFAPQSLTGRIAASAIKYSAVGLSEGGEEAYQAAIQQSAAEGGSIIDKLKRFNPEMAESAVVGALFGYGMAGAGSVYTALTDRVEANMDPQTAQAYEQSVQTQIAAGKAPHEAQLAALDELAATPEGKAHIDKVISDLKAEAEGRPVAPATQEEMTAVIDQVEKLDAVIPEAEAQALVSDQNLEAIAKGELSVEQLLGFEPETVVEEPMSPKGGPGKESTGTQAPKPEGGIGEHNVTMLDQALQKKPQGVFFHGSEFGSLDLSADGGSFGGALFLTDDPNFALSYSKQDPREVYSFKIQDEAKLLNLGDQEQVSRFTDALMADDDFRSELMRDDLYGGEDGFREFLQKSLNSQDFQEHTDFESEIFRRVAQELGYDGAASRGELVIWNHDALESTFRPNLSSPPSGGGQTNFLISEESYQAALASLTEKTSGLHAGIDPTILADYVKIGAYHLERGVRKFAEWSKLMLDRFGESIKPHLTEIFEQSESMINRGVPSGVDLGDEALKQTKSVEGATQPAKAVKPQIRLTTGQKRIAKVISEDEALRAGMKKAEQASRVAYAAGNKDAFEAAKLVMQDIVQRATIKAEMFGFREGFKLAERLTNKELTTVFKQQAKSAEVARSKIAELIQENLPPELQGKFLDAAVKDLTARRQNDLMDRIAAASEKATKQDLIDEIDQFRDYSGSIDVQYQKRIDALLGDLNTKKISPATIAKLESLVGYAAKTGMPSGVSPKTLTALRRLENRQASEMDEADLKEIRDAAAHLTEMGKLKRRLKLKYNERERQDALEVLLKSTYNLDFTDSGKNTSFDIMKKGAVDVHLSTLSPLRVAELIDGAKARGANFEIAQRLSKAEENAIWNARDRKLQVAEKVDPSIDFTKEETNARIMVNKLMMEGADEAVLTLMERFGWSEIPELRAGEREAIETIRSVTTQRTDEIAALFEETQNQEFVRLPGWIMSLKYENEFHGNPEEAMLQTPHRTAQTERGFTIERKAGVKKMPRIDVMGVFEQTIEEQEWYLNMQPELDQVRRLINKKDYLNRAGTSATNWWIDHLDIIARRGWTAAASRANQTGMSKFLRFARGNISKGILGYRLSSILMQPMAVFDAMAYVSGEFGPSASAEVLAEFGKTWITPGRSGEIISGSKALQNRTAGEVAVQELMQNARSGSLKDKFARGGMALLQKGDVITAAGVQQGVENILTRRGVANAKAEAETIMQLVSSSSDVTLRPHILARGEGARTFFTFQTFLLNRWGIIAHDLVTKGLVKGDYKKKMAALIGLGIIVAGKMAEDEARTYLYEKLKGRERKKREVPLIIDATFGLASNIPVFGNAFELYASRGGSSDIPLQKLMNDVFRAPVVAATSKKPEAIGKAALRGVEALAVIAGGQPGTSQAFDVLEGILYPTSRSR